MNIPIDICYYFKYCVINILSIFRFFDVSFLTPSVKIIFKLFHLAFSCRMKLALYQTCEQGFYFFLCRFTHLAVNGFW